MDTKTLIAISLMVLIYFYFFAPSPNQSPTEPTTTSSAQVETKVSQPSSLPEKVPTDSDANLRLKLFILETNQIQLQMNGLGEISSIGLREFWEQADHADKRKVGWGFEDFSFNRVLPEEQNWKITRTDGQHLEIESRNGDIITQRAWELKEGEFGVRYTEVVTNNSTTSIEVPMTFVLRKRIEKPKESVGSKIKSFFQFFAPPADFQQVVWLSKGDLHAENLVALPAVVFPKGNRVENLPEDKVRLETESLSWAGFSTKYFFLGLIPQNSSLTKVTAKKGDLSGVQIGELRAELLSKQIPPKGTAEFSNIFYFGPKKISELRKVGPDLEKVVDYGNWIGPISRVLLALLLFFYSLIPNYGLGIILLTLVVKSLLFPLAYRAAISMRKLSIVQPKMKEIQEKYKTDKQRMQIEMMNLYKTEKVNPIGGCLPILLQMPIFFALYRVFFSSIEMRHAPFMLWIQDLSSRDPFFVLPVLMTALMWFQQKLTPMPNAGGEETEAIRVQKAMYKWMPYIFGLFTLFMPAGLTLYFVVNSILSIVQQLWMNKKLEKMFPRPVSASKSSANA